MLSNAYLLAKIGADTADNEQHSAENLPIGRRVADRCPIRVDWIPAGQVRQRKSVRAAEAVNRWGEL